MFRRLMLAIAALATVTGAAAAPLALAQEPAAERLSAQRRQLVTDKRRALGLARLPTSFGLPAGTLSVRGAEQLAAVPGSTLHLEVSLDRRAAGAALLVTLPGRLARRAPSGLRGAGTPALTRSAGGAARLGRSDGTVTLDLGGAAKGATASVDIPVGATPAGTYALPLRWRTADGTTTDAGTVRLRIYARSRDDAERLRDAGEGGAAKANPWRDPLRTQLPSQPADASGDTGEESESFDVVDPRDRQRLLSAGNKIQATSHDAGISNDGGRTWTPLDIAVNGSGNTAIAGPSGAELSQPSGDPIMVADDLGDFWFGGLTLCDPTTQSPSRIYVNRIAAGTNAFNSVSAGLPIKTPPGQCTGDPNVDAVQDKPMMSIDNARTSPTYGRINVTWDDFDPSAGVSVVLSACDTRVNGVPQPQRCDSGANWSRPVVVSGAPGSYITSHSATGPDGHVYVVWWNYGADNAVQMATCASQCTSQPSWGAPGNIAVLDTTGGAPVPFACPILAQPGGRAAPVPSVAVDHSGGSDDGRIYVGWADLRPGSGSTRCTDAAAPAGNPLVTHQTFDAYVATGTSFAQLTTGATTISSARGSRIVNDAGTNASATNSDDWFSWVAVDQTTGKAWTDAYSTAPNSPRLDTEVLLSQITSPFTQTKPTLTAPTVVSTVRSSYSDTTPCCQFDNDYGDYTGLDAAEDQPYPVWTDRQIGQDGDVFVWGLTSAAPHVVHDAATLVEAAPSDGDGLAEPGEGAGLTERVRNAGTGAEAVNITAVASPVPGVTVSGAANLGSVGTGATAQNPTPFAGSLPASLPCDGLVDYFITYANATDVREVLFTAPAACNDKFSVAGTTVSESGGNATVTVTRASPSSTPATVRIDTSDDSATAPGDYTALSNGTVSFAAGQASETVSIPIIDDATNEPSQRFKVSLSAPSLGSHVATGDAFVTITDDDAAPSTPVTTTTGTTTTTTTTTPPKPDLTPPKVRFGKFPPRLSPTRRLRLAIGPMTEAVTGKLTLATSGRVTIAPGRKRVVTLGRRTFNGAKGKTTRLTLRFSAQNTSLLRRRGHLRLRLTIVLTDAAGNRATRVAIFTLLPPKKPRPRF